MSARPARRTWRSALTVLALGASLLPGVTTGASASPVNSAGATATYLTVRPAAPIASETVKASGQLPDRAARPVSLQRLSGTSWITVAQSTSTATGTYATSFRAPAVGNHVIRLLAPATTISGVVHPRIIGTHVSLPVTAQTASLALPSALVEGASGSASMSFTPARPGRAVSLQAYRAGAWQTVASGTQSASGSASLPVSEASRGSYQYRARTAAARGAPAWNSAARSLTVTATPPPPPASLSSGHTLTAGQSLRSPNRQYQAVMQGDGNFVVYQSGVGALWSTRTGAAGSSIVMQGDGNLVVYAPGGLAQWSSSTAPSSGDSLVMQDDGNLVVYSRGGLPLWASRGGRTGFAEDTLPTSATLGVGNALYSRNGRYTAVMQGDGNLVVYEVGVRALWATGTGTPGSVAVMQGDGNLVVYAPGGAAAWSSDTNPSADDVLVMQDDANLVIYSSTGAVWSWRDGRLGGAKYGPGPNATLCDGTDYHCDDTGYVGQSTWGYPGVHNCTNYAAWRLSRRGVANPGNLGNAGSWADSARGKGLTVNGTPAVGSVAQYNYGSTWAPKYGHVAYVIEVGPGYVVLAEDNYPGTFAGHLDIRRANAGTYAWPNNFIHF